MAGDHGERYFFPAESGPHQATILGFPSRDSLPRDHVNMVRVEIIELAESISKFEPVRLYVREEEIPIARGLIDARNPGMKNVTIIPIPIVHPWVRDTGPIYVWNPAIPGQRNALNFNFNEWGDKPPKPGKLWGALWPQLTEVQLEENTKFAARVIHADKEPSDTILIESKLRLEGGALVSDGDGTLLITESSIICEKRNPGWTKPEIEGELKRILGVEKVIWFKGLRNMDITDCHVDAITRFVKPGVLVLSRPHATYPQVWRDVAEEAFQVLSKETDAKGRRFEIHELHEPDPNEVFHLETGEGPLSYVNWYHVNGGLIVPKFGDMSGKDDACKKKLQGLFPELQVKQVHILHIALTGGGIHCMTQQVPA